MEVVNHLAPKDPEKKRKNSVLLQAFCSLCFLGLLLVSSFIIVFQAMGGLMNTSLRACFMWLDKDSSA